MRPTQTRLAISLPSDPPFLLRIESRYLTVIGASRSLQYYAAAYPSLGVSVVNCRTRHHHTCHRRGTVHAHNGE